MRIRRVLVFLGVLVASLLTAAVAFAEEEAASGGGDDGSMRYMAAAFAIGVAAFGGALGQARAAAAALEGIARNPQAGGRIFTSMILALALIESLVIYALVISFSIL
jgi:F-type H+-transporting ATPase subunit c